MLELSTRQKIILEKCFSEEDYFDAQSYIEKNAGRTIPFCGNSSPEQLDRIRFAIIKQSDGCLSKLKEGIDLAHSDWRKLLISADFGIHPQAHDDWFKKKLNIIAWWRC
ncbi:hypothetical protein [Aliikangiella sp. G2MR2-5]|uniref:hypothetical protein n=1 Tax=Aliikangiella sp. G2MR2-5 TaxID=2788943 RepID=UPI0018A8A09D|nr:hypothetical protein [Aliikangiella sp. G2MR2-5]